MYVNCQSCMHALYGIEAVDYFFAVHMQQQLGNPDDEVVFHMLLACQWALRQGHTRLPLVEVAGQRFFEDSERAVRGYRFAALTTLEDCVSHYNLAPEAGEPVVFDDGSLYLRRYWQFEVEVAAAIRQRMAHQPLTAAQTAKARETLEKLFANNESGKTDWQKVAVANALGRKLSIISGGPGTGKTYTVTRLLATLQSVHDGKLKIRMAAPTGKAAQRLNESVMHARQELHRDGIAEDILATLEDNASTVHRLLGIAPQRVELKYNEHHPLHCDVLLIDEVSMIDLPTMARILRAMPEDAILVLLGDANQLPSVETGNVLADMVEREHPGYRHSSAEQIKAISGEDVAEYNASNYSHVTWLEQSHRFGGAIGQLAEDVITSKQDQSWTLLQNNRQNTVNFNARESGGVTYLEDSLLDEWLIQACENYYLKISQARTLPEAFSALAAFRILVPGRRDERGVEPINQLIEKQLSNKRRSIRPGLSYAGKPVMVTQNNYSLGLFNGDIGLIWPDEENDNHLMAWFETDDQSYRSVSLARLPHYETVYAMTIHKTQGSEFNHVAVVLPQKESRLLSPELLYTGLTRAKEHLYILSSETIWKAALEKRTWRYSGLKTRLED